MAGIGICYEKFCGDCGAGYRNRTGDLLITSQLLYLLSQASIMRMLKDVLNNVIRADLCHATDHYRIFRFVTTRAGMN